MKTLEQNYQTKIDFLKANPELSGTPIITIKEEKVYSNCHGTVLFVLNQEDYLTTSKWGDKVGIYWDKKQGRPSSVDKRIMKDFLENRCKQIDTPKIGDMVIFQNTPQFLGSLAHSAILYESSNGDSKIFHQINTADSFEIVSLKNFIKYHPQYKKKFFELKN